MGRPVWTPLAALALFLVAAVGPAGDAVPPADYPAKPVTVIVPFAKGGGLDVSIRLVGKYAEPILGQPLVVVNRTGGGNIRGNHEGIAARPDGYTLGVWGMGLVTDELLVRNCPYTYRDVRPVCMYSNDTHVIALGGKFAREKGISTLAGLIEYARANPGRVTFGVGGNWSTHDFVRVKIERLAGVRFARMPFLGGAPAMRAAATGNCDVVVPFLPEFMPYAGADAVVPLAVAFGERLANLPAVPTTAEAGYPAMVQTMWRVVTVPKGTPEDIVRRLEAVFARVTSDSDFIREARELGLGPTFMGTDDLAAFLEEQFAEMERVTEELGIRVGLTQ